MNEVSHKPAHTVTELVSARQHHRPGRPPWSARWRVVSSPGVRRNPFSLVEDMSDVEPSISQSDVFSIHRNNTNLCYSDRKIRERRSVLFTEAFLANEHQKHVMAHGTSLREVETSKPIPHCTATACRVCSRWPRANQSGVQWFVCCIVLVFPCVL